MLEPRGYPTEAKAQISILKNHYLYEALTTKRTDVPKNYITQFWLSAELERIDGHGMCITGYATNPDSNVIIHLGLNKGTVKPMLNLPTKNDMNIIRYSDKPSNAEICRLLEFISYNEPLDKKTEFRRYKLPPSMERRIFNIEQGIYLQSWKS